MAQDASRGRSLSRTSTYRPAQTRRNSYIQVTLATSVFCFVNPYTRMSGSELVYNLFAECRPGDTHFGLCILNPPEQALSVIGAIAVALVVKGALTIITFGIKVPAGIFIPSLGGKHSYLDQRGIL